MPIGHGEIRQLVIYGVLYFWPVTGTRKRKFPKEIQTNMKLFSLWRDLCQKSRRQQRANQKTKTWAGVLLMFELDQFSDFYDQSSLQMCLQKNSPKGSLSETFSHWSNMFHLKQTCHIWKLSCWATVFCSPGVLHVSRKLQL